MKKIDFVIHPLEGLDELEFGASMNEIENTLGKPADKEDVEDLGEDFDESLDTKLWNYDELGLSVFFEGKNNHVLSCFETDNEEATLFGKKIFTLSEKEIIDLMKSEGIEEMDVAEEEWGEKRISFDELLIDFYFQDGKLVTVNWGVFVNEDGDIVGIYEDEEMDEEA